MIFSLLILSYFKFFIPLLQTESLTQPNGKRSVYAQMLLVGLAPDH